MQANVSKKVIILHNPSYKQELSEANHRARWWAGEKLNISPLDIGHKWSDIGLKVIINIDTNHMCLYSIYILQHYTKQCPKE